MIWFLIIKSGVIVGSIGPSPLTMDQCNRFAQDRTVEINQAIKTGINLKGETIPEKHLAAFKTMSFRCIERSERPKLGERL